MNTLVIEALEAFADERNWRYQGRFDPNSSIFDGTETARLALEECKNMQPPDILTLVQKAP